MYSEKMSAALGRGSVPVNLLQRPARPGQAWVGQCSIMGQGGGMKPNPFLRDTWHVKVVGAGASFFITM